MSYSINQIDYYPLSSSKSSETHATLLLLKQTVENPVSDFELAVDLATVNQLRKGTTANPWEVFWLFFGYKGSTASKTTNYFISKPAPYGSELGLASGTVTQEFLNNSTVSPTEIGSRHVFTYRKQANVFSVRKDGQLIYSYTDSAKKLYANKGSLGFYSEDAHVQIYSVQFRSLD